MKRAIGFLALLAGSLAMAACGSGSATSSPTAAASATSTAGAGRLANRTPRPEIETAIAEGTMPAGPGGRFGGTPSADQQTAIAEGTLPAGRFGGTPSGAMQTAIASGTFPAGRGFGGGGRTVTTVAVLLGISEDQLQTELQAAGATIASVAAAHGEDRTALRQALISDAQQRIQAQVTNGRMSQDAADGAIAAYENNVDSVLDSDGSMTAGVPTPGG